MMLDPETARAMGIPDDLATGSLLGFLVALWRRAHGAR